MAQLNNDSIEYSRESFINANTKKLTDSHRNANQTSFRKVHIVRNMFRVTILNSPKHKCNNQSEIAYRSTSYN